MDLQLSGTKLEKECKSDLYNTLCELCEAKIRVHDSAGAAEAAKAALAIGRETKNSSRRGEAYMLLGMALLVASQWTAARRAFNHARVYAKNMDELKRERFESEFGNLSNPMGGLNLDQFGSNDNGSSTTLLLHSLIRNLKNAVRLQRYHDALESDDADKDDLHEKIGDTLIDVGLHRSAIEAYKKVEEPFAHKCKR